jgi:hypothetical protein
MFPRAPPSPRPERLRALSPGAPLGLGQLDGAAELFAEPFAVLGQRVLAQALKAPKSRFWLCFEHSWEFRMDLIQTFLTITG